MLWITCILRGVFDAGVVCWVYGVVCVVFCLRCLCCMCVCVVCVVWYVCGVCVHMVYCEWSEVHVMDIVCVAWCIDYVVCSV